MRTLTNAATHDPTHDPTGALIEAVKQALADLDSYSVGDMTDEVEVAEMVGRLRSLAGVLVSVVDRE